MQREIHTTQKYFFQPSMLNVLAHLSLGTHPDGIFIVLYRTRRVTHVTMYLVLCIHWTEESFHLMMRSPWQHRENSCYREFICSKKSALNHLSCHFTGLSRSIMQSYGRLSDLERPVCMGEFLKVNGTATKFSGMTLFALIISSGKFQLKLLNA